jgi:hypothetical protein
MMDQMQSAPKWEDWSFQKVRNWKLKLCWRPQTCFLTGKQLWGRKAYYGVRMITGPGDPVFDQYWVEKDEFLLSKLKGKV